MTVNMNLTFLDRLEAGGWRREAEGGRLEEQKTGEHGDWSYDVNDEHKVLNSRC